MPRTMRRQYIGSTRKKVDQLINELDRKLAQERRQSWQPEVKPKPVCEVVYILVRGDNQILAACAAHRPTAQPYPAKHAIFATSRVLFL